MSRARIGAAVFVAIQLTFSGLASAAAPRLQWRTIVTPRFRIHYHEGTAAAAVRVSQWAEPTLDALVGLLDSHPEVPIHVVITDETDSPNGFAEVVPQNVVTMFAGIPTPFSTLGDYDDFLKLLFVHELTHIVHLDAVSGVPRWVNAVLGKQWVPNLIQPSWFIEGVAVYAESTFTAGGRNRSAFVDLLVREQVIGDCFPDLGVLSHWTRRFPGGSFPWFLGGRFLDFIARRHGVDAVAAMSKDYGGRALPYGLNLVARRATGEDFEQLWAAWKAEEERRAQRVLDRVAREGRVEGTRLDRPSPLVTHPRFSSRGDLLIVESPRDDDLEIVVLGPDLVTERGRFRTSDGRSAWVPDGTRIVATVQDTFRQRFSYTDLEIIDLTTGRRRRRTRGARLSAPDVSADGRTIVAVQQGGGASWLVTLPIEGDGPPSILARPGPGRMVFDPRYAPDGSTVVASVSDPATGARQLVLFDVANGRSRPLTRGRDRHLQPAWSPDGRQVFFTSDAGGVYDLHRLEVATGRVDKITNVVTGAFFAAPHPTRDSLWFTLGQVEGWSLQRLDAPEARPDALLVARPARSASVAVELHPHEPYAAWESLLPKAYLPSWSEDGLGNVFGISISGTDAVKAHAYTLDLRYGVRTRRIGYGFNYANRQTFVGINLSSSLSATTRPGRFAPLVADDDHLQSIFRARLTSSFPLGVWDTGHSVFVSYGFELRRAVALPAADPFDDPSSGASDLTLGSMSFGWSYGQVRGFAESFGAAAGTGFDVQARIHDPALGSDLRVFDVSGHARAFWSVPGLRHHVVALRLGFGASSGDTGGRATYVLGGLPVRNVVSDAIDDLGVGADVIRGYPVASIRGSSFYLLNAEYRLPIWTLSEGLATLPLFLDRLSAAAFIDMGDAPSGPIRADAINVGVGAEVRLELAIAYVRRLLLRFGYGRGLTNAGTNNVFLALGGVY